MHAARHSAGCERGLTLVEVMAAVFVFAVAMGAAGTLLVVLLRQAEATSETELAASAISSKIEDMRSHYPYGGTSNSLFVTFASSTFAVPGLAKADGSNAGRVEFIDEAALLTSPNLAGLQLDIDGDGVLAEAQTQAELAAAVAAGRASAVRVEVQWRGREGERTITVDAVMFRSENE